MGKIAQTIARTELKTLIFPLLHIKLKYDHKTLHYWWLIALSNYGVGTII